MRKTIAWATLALAASTFGVGISTPAQSAPSSDRDSALEALAAHPRAARAAAGQAFSTVSTVVDRGRRDPRPPAADLPRAPGGGR